MSKPASINIEIAGLDSLTVDDVWPDGDAPTPITAEAVAEAMGTADIARIARDWALRLQMTITVDAPNPHHTQSESLLPELAPAERIRTEKVIG